MQVHSTEQKCCKRPVLFGSFLNFFTCSEQLWFCACLNQRSHLCIHACPSNKFISCAYVDMSSQEVMNKACGTSPPQIRVQIWPLTDMFLGQHPLANDGPIALIILPFQYKRRNKQRDKTKMRRRTGRDLSSATRVGCKPENGFDPWKVRHWYLFKPSICELNCSLANEGQR